MTFASKVLQYYSQLIPPTNLPSTVEVMNPYNTAMTKALATAFYKKYYHDHQERIICFGINPGRFGAGITGVPFTDPIRLETACGIPNTLTKKAELSSKFIYDMIAQFDDVKTFYSKIYISAVSPLGYLKDGINLNYYDIKEYHKIFEDYARAQIEFQLDFGISRRIAFSIGKGKNLEFLNWLNKKYSFFEKIIPLSHPRWIMQYRLKRKDEFIKEYVTLLNSSTTFDGDI